MSHVLRQRSVRSIPSLIALLAVLALLATPAAMAQTTIQTKHASVTFSGKLDITTVYRNSAFFQANKGQGGFTPGNPATGTTPFLEGLDNTTRLGNTPKGGADEFYLDPNVSLRFDIDVGEKIRGVVELRTPFKNLDAGGKNSNPGNNFTAGFRDRTLEVKQLYAQADDLFWQGFSITAGIQDFRKDLRGDGNAFVIDVSGSEDPFDGALPSFAGNRGGGRPRVSTGFADSLEAAGGLLRQTFGQSTENSTGIVVLDAWAFDIDERFRSGGASAPEDRYFWGFSGDFYLGSEGEFGKLQAMVFDLMNGTDAHMFTAGGGFDVYPLTRAAEIQWELFAEAYGQGGEYASSHLPNGEDLDQKEGFAVQAGSRLAFPVLVTEDSEFVPFLEGSYVEVSGDSNYTDDANQNFVSLENNNRTIIVENGYYGYDIDTNYRGVRLSLGANYQIPGQGSLRAEVLYAYFEYQDNGGGKVTAGTTRSRKIGDEIDLSLEYSYEAISLGFRHGWLLDAKGLGLSQDIMINLFEVGLTF